VGDERLGTPRCANAVGKMWEVVTRSDAARGGPFGYWGGKVLRRGMTRQMYGIAGVLDRNNRRREIAVVAQELGGSAEEREEELRGRVVTAHQRVRGEDSGVLTCLPNAGRDGRSMHPLQCSASRVGFAHRWKARFLRLGRGGETLRSGLARQIARALGGIGRHIAGSRKYCTRGGEAIRGPCARAGGKRHAVAAIVGMRRSEAGARRC